MSDIYELIENHLKKIGRNGLLPAGVILIGGGAYTQDAEEMAKFSLHLPAKIAQVPFNGDAHGMRESGWATAIGLCILGFTQGEEPSAGIKIVHKTKNSIIAWIKQFLP